MNLRRTTIAVALTNIGIAIAGLEACSSTTEQTQPSCRPENGCYSSPCPQATQVQASAEIACEVALASSDARATGGAVCAKACPGGASCSIEPAFLDEMKRHADASVPEDAAAGDAAAVDGGDASAGLASSACPKRAATVTCTPFCGGGRGTNGIEMHSPPADSAGAHFSQMAELEAISVLAFLRMASELEHLGAPPELVASARSAAREEGDHVAVMTQLAVARGATVVLPAGGGAFEPRSLFELARENAREGCVRESYGAVVASFAAARAEDRDVRDVMARVADEEAGHAQLSWELHSWSWSRLTEAERAEVGAELARARRSLRDSLCDRQAWGRRVGLPSDAEAQRLLDATEALLFAA